MRCYDKIDDDTYLRSFRDDVLDIAYHSKRKENYFAVNMTRFRSVNMTKI